jgi:hypothetical protein
MDGSDHATRGMATHPFVANQACAVSGRDARSWANARASSDRLRARSGRALSGKALVRSIMAAHPVRGTQRRRWAGTSSHAKALARRPARRCVLSWRGTSRRGSDGPHVKCLLSGDRSANSQRVGRGCDTGEAGSWEPHQNAATRRACSSAGSELATRPSWSSAHRGALAVGGLVCMGRRSRVFVSPAMTSPIGRGLAEE